MKWPQTVSRVWQDPRGRAWLVEVQFAPVGGRLECVGVTVQSHRGSSPFTALPGEPRAVLTALMLRKLPLGEIVQELRENLARRYAPDSVTVLRDEEPEPDAGDEDAMHELISGRRRRLDPEHWRVVARVYLDAHLRGRAPTQAVARRFGLQYSGAAKQVQKARRLHDPLTGLPYLTTEYRTSPEEGS
jgi:hypothetical protein